MKRSAREYLLHIRDEGEFLRQTSAGLDRESLLRDETLKRAVVRSIEIIGEAVKNIPDGSETSTLTLSGGRLPE